MDIYGVCGSQDVVWVNPLCLYLWNNRVLYWFIVGKMVTLTIGENLIHSVVMVLLDMGSLSFRLRFRAPGERMNVLTEHST